MKKILSIIVMLLLGLNLFGQVGDKYGMVSNSIEISVGDASVASYAGLVVGVIIWSAEAIADGVAGNDEQPQSTGITSWTPCITVGYDHHFTDSRWNLGGELGFWHMGLGLNNGDRILGFMETATATSKFFYKPYGKCKLYGGVNLGVGLVEIEDLSVFPAFQVNPIGMKIGNDKISFVAELGFGYKGIIQTGVSITI